MIVVSDATPLRYLAVLGELEVLARLFGEVFCPREVMEECLNPSAPQLLQAWASDPPDWLKVMDPDEIDERVLDLDRGEAEAISLAIQLKAQLLLIDEKKGRARAAQLGVKRTGTLAILAQAARRGWLDYETVTQRLMRETNFRATAAVIDATWNNTVGGSEGPRG